MQTKVSVIVPVYIMEAFSAVHAKYCRTVLLESGDHSDGRRIV